MNRTESAIKILDAQGAYCGQCSREPGDSLNACRDCADVLETYAHALEAAGLLMPDVQVIRTVEELEALDPDTAVISAENGAAYYVKNLTERHTKTFLYVPAVVIATGAQVRAAREAMEEDHG